MYTKKKGGILDPILWTYGGWDLFMIIVWIYLHMSTVFPFCQWSPAY